MELSVIRGGGGGWGRSPKNYFRPFGPQFGLEIRGVRPPGSLPWIRHRGLSQARLSGEPRTGAKRSASGEPSLSSHVFLYNKPLPDFEIVGSVKLVVYKNFREI